MNTLATVTPFEPPSLPLVERRDLSDTSAIYVAKAAAMMLYMGLSGGMVTIDVSTCIG